MSSRNTTTDIESLTNSVMQAMEKEFRKNDMGGAFHAQYDANRAIILGMVASVVVDHLADFAPNQMSEAVLAKIEAKEKADA